MTAPVKRKTRRVWPTKREIDALDCIVHERVAGGTEDLRDALGCSLDEASTIMSDAMNAIEKLFGGVKV